VVLQIEHLKNCNSMQRRNFLKWSSLVGFTGLVPSKKLIANSIGFFATWNTGNA
jgi:hypothetical protein